MRVHMERYHPIGRMFADRYCRTDDRVVFPATKEQRTAVSTSDQYEQSSTIGVARRAY